MMIIEKLKKLIEEDLKLKLKLSKEEWVVETGDGAVLGVFKIYRIRKVTLFSGHCVIPSISLQDLLNFLKLNFMIRKEKGKLSD